MSTKKDRSAKRKAKRSAEQPRSGQIVSGPLKDELQSMSRVSRRVEQQRPNIKVIRDVPGQEKMSVVLERFIHPYVVEFGDTRDAYHRLVAVAVVAWNATIMAPERREQMLEKVAQTFPADLRQDYRIIVGDLMQRKTRHFARNRRLIVDYEIIDQADQYHLAVVSTLNPEAATSPDIVVRLAGEKPSLWARIRRFFKV